MYYYCCMSSGLCWVDILDGSGTHSHQVCWHRCVYNHDPRQHTYPQLESDDMKRNATIIYSGVCRTKPVTTCFGGLLATWKQWRQAVNTTLSHIHSPFNSDLVSSSSWGKYLAGFAICLCYVYLLLHFSALVKQRELVLLSCCLWESKADLWTKKMVALDILEVWKLCKYKKSTHLFK